MSTDIKVDLDRRNPQNGSGLKRRSRGVATRSQRQVAATRSVQCWFDERVPIAVVMVVDEGIVSLCGIESLLAVDKAFLISNANVAEMPKSVEIS